MNKPSVLTFVVPVRHQSNAREWSELKSNLAHTLRSLSSQTAPNWRALVVANHGADLPPLPPKVEAVRVDFPPNPLHERGTADEETFYDAVRLDKGRRILAGMLHAGRGGYLMVVDDDDLVSSRLAEFVARHDGEHGWFVKDGYFWPTGGRMLYAHGNFSRYCGTSHIVRADLYDAPARFEDASEWFVTRLLGSHVFLEEHLRARGTPLAPLPFSGAVYRIGHAGSHSRSSGLVRTFFLTRRNLRNPVRLLDAALRLRPLTTRVRGEFFGGGAA
ncbi:MAG TPA: glycosyltransferase family A protein [Candidatus Limnocylindria bacterium]|nr:glycosyltransferase family A protein [Candidatus Limnocylindria bacterium]